MKIRELIEKLKNFDLDYDVYIQVNGKETKDYIIQKGTTIDPVSKIILDTWVIIKE